MSGFIECPNCVNDRLIVPLTKEGKTMICPLCQFRDEINLKVRA